MCVNNTLKGSVYYDLDLKISQFKLEKTVGEERKDLGQRELAQYTVPSSHELRQASELSDLAPELIGDQRERESSTALGIQRHPWWENEERDGKLPADLTKTAAPKTGRIGSGSA
jgi:hypothetical protein